MRNPKILLIHPPSDCVEDDKVEPPLGLLYLASSLLESGYKGVSVLDMAGCKTRTEISDRISIIPVGDVYGINCFSTNYDFAKEIIKNIRDINPFSYIVLGGPHPSAVPVLTLNDSGADAVVVGEGEDLFRSSIDSLLAGSPLKGILRGEGREDIDSYAFPARHLVRHSDYSRRLFGQPIACMLSSRGCVHHCTHCNSVVMGGGNKKVRYRTSANILDEIRSLRDQFRYYRFNDDHFTGNPNLERLLTEMKDLDIKFRIFARVEDLDSKVCKLLQEAGCVHISIGLESLNTDNLRMLGKKGQIGKEGNVRIAKDNGLLVRSSFMVGLPYDTDETIRKHFAVAASLGLDEFAVYPLIPYPGTMIWKHPERFGYTVVNPNFNDYIQIGKNGKACYALKHKNFTPQDVANWLQTATGILKNGGVKHITETKVAT